MVDAFTRHFLPGSSVLYQENDGSFDEQVFAEIGINIDKAEKMPDLVMHYPQKDWVLLIEAVTSHGPVDSKRREELAHLFHKVKSKLIYVTAFPNKSLMTRYLSDISWETEVWIADSPTHLIHFNGERSLGPYE